MGERGESRPEEPGARVQFLPPALVSHYTGGDLMLPIDEVQEYEVAGTVRVTKEGFRYVCPVCKYPDYDVYLILCNGVLACRHCHGLPSFPMALMIAMGKRNMRMLEKAISNEVEVWVKGKRQKLSLILAKALRWL